MLKTDIIPEGTKVCYNSSLTTKKDGVKHAVVFEFDWTGISVEQALYTGSKDLSTDILNRSRVNDTDSVERGHAKAQKIATMLEEQASSGKVAIRVAEMGKGFVRTLSVDDQIKIADATQLELYKKAIEDAILAKKNSK